MTPPDDFDPPIGQPALLEAGVRRIVAPNPSPMTYRGTNTYLFGTGSVAVIDPGPMSDAHLEAILDATTRGRDVSHILVTHAHLDHSPLAHRLAQTCSAPVLAFGPAHAGRSAVMEQLAESGLVGGGEGIDEAFQPDEVIADGAVIHGKDWQLEAIHTPGHIGNHLSFASETLCFTGDHVMGWASSLVSPPDGDLTDFMRSCATLRSRDWRVFYPGHGGPVSDPAARLDWLIGHRQGREASILEALSQDEADAETLARAIYTETPAALLPAATRNVLAHLIDLSGRGLAEPVGALRGDAVFRRT